MNRFGLSLKIFLATAAIVTAVLVVTLVVTSASARTSAERAIQRGLGETNARIAEQLTARQDGLAGRLNVFSQNPLVVTTVLADTSGNNAFDQAGEAVAASLARWVQFIDTNAVVLAKSDDRGAKGRDLAGSPLVRGALQGKTISGLGVSGDTAIVQLVALPLLANQNSKDSRSVSGVIMGALQVGDSLAKAIGEVTGSELAFYVVDKNGVPHLAGATIPVADRDALQREVHSRMHDSATVKPTRSAAPAESSTKAISAMGAASDRTDISLGGRAYIGQMTPLLSVVGNPVGGFLSLRSLDAELAPYYSLRKRLLVTGALGLIVAFLLSGAITRQIVRPVKALVSATRRAADGDYAAEIPAHGADEIGTLAEAVRRLLGDLRDKQALVEFLGAGGRAMSTATFVGGDTEATALMPGAPAAARGVALTPGSSLGVRYDIKSVLGAGGMGMVYRAVDRELGEVVAIKTLKPELIAADTTALERFKSEIRLARKISHRNVVRTHDLGEAQGLYFITMEYVEGTSLKELVRARGRLPVHVLLPIAKQLCRALEVAHEAGVIHRDIKPHNMVVERDGTLKVMDFGIARLATRAPSQGLTEAGMIIGTPEYMSPEQLLGDELDVRADIYSAGVVMYECLTGRLPFEAPSPIVLISRVLEETPASPSALFDDIPQPVSALVMRAMARERDARPATAQQLHDALEQVG